LFENFEKQYITEKVALLLGNSTEMVHIQPDSRTPDWLPSVVVNVSSITQDKNNINHAESRSGLSSPCDDI
jgi:hypothetical protein